MEKNIYSGVRIIAGLSIIILIFAVLLMPSPRYYRHKACTSSVNENCGSNVIEWGPSIASRIRSQVTTDEKPLEPLAIPTTSPTITQNWDTYRNDKFGFQFKYPQEMDVVSEGSDRFAHIAILSIVDGIDSINSFDLTIMISSTDKSKSDFNECLQGSGKEKVAAGLNSSNVELVIHNETLDLNGNNACIQKMSAENQLIQNVLLEKGGNIYTFQFFTEGDSGLINAISGQILSTLIITEE